MIRARRPQVEPTDDWQQLQLLIQFPEQRSYEVLRPVVLFGQSPAQRALQTGVPQRTLYRQVDRFEREGMHSLFAPAKAERHRRVPAPVRAALLELKAEHPPFRPHELTTICWVRFGHSLSHHTVKRILADGPLPAAPRRRYPPYHQMADAYARRHAVVTLHAEGWNIKTIAAYMGVDRHTVYAVLRRWIADGPAGLEDKSSTPHATVRKVTLSALVAVADLQQNPELGAFRIHAALRQIGIHLSPRTCGRILARNRALYGLPKPARAPRNPEPMPFQAGHRHQYWTVDIRYLDHQLSDGHVYCISVIDNFSRAILASMPSRRQDLSAYLLVLHAAISQHGAPEALVSDSGSVFLAKEAARIYQQLGILKHEIERGQPWQSYIETAFNVQRRMADWAFARATTWDEIVRIHDRWVADYNTQSHLAHQQRQDERRSPAEVLAWVQVRPVAEEALDRIFRHARSTRRVDALGYVRFRHWRLSGERGLSGERVAVWLSADTLTLEYRDEPLAEYRVRYQAAGRQFAAVSELQLFATPHQSLQPPVWEWHSEEWLRIIKLPAYRLRRKAAAGTEQGRLFS